MKSSTLVNAKLPGPTRPFKLAQNTILKLKKVKTFPCHNYNTTDVTNKSKRFPTPHVEAGSESLQKQ